MALSKKKFDIKSISEKYSSKTKYKPEAFYSCGEAFYHATGKIGPVMGGITMLLGHSDTGKSTSLISAAIDAQKKGHLPVFLITEKKWSWDRAITMGLQAEQNENGEWVGDFIYNDSFDYIEKMTDFINMLLDEQEKGNIPYSLLFLIDSIGSIPCKMTKDGKGGKMHNASVLSDKIGLGLHSRISDSKKDDYPYYNSMIIVNQPWVAMADNPYEQPKIMPKGGEAIWLASTLVFLFGNEKKAGISKITATKNGRTVAFGTRTKISVLKDHSSGLSFKDGKVISTPHGFILDTKEALDQYKKDNSEYWKGILTGGDVEDVTFEEHEIEDEEFVEYSDN